MHSDDFENILGGVEKIDGKTLPGWENEFGIVGLIAHMKEIGWSKYQWNLRTESDKEAARKYWAERHSGEPIPADREPKCFAEFFGSSYCGYLRGDAETVRGAVESCVARAQKYLACEHKTGHKFQPYKGSNGVEYANGLIACVHCGFNGYSSVIKSLRMQVQHLSIALDIEKRSCAERERYMEEHGEPWHKQFEPRSAC